MDNDKQLDLAGFRARLASGKEYWQSLQELADNGEFDSFVEQEFPQQAAPLGKGVDRRDFMKLMGASMAAAGLAACNRPAEAIIPYVRQPENLIPGKPIFFASAMTLGGYANGILVESHMGRPTKIEGNPDHPASLGATDAFMQASVLGLYDPDRSTSVMHYGETATWSDFLAALQPVLKQATANGGSLRILTQTITSPSLGAMLQQVVAQYPGVKWHQWDAVNQDNVREGARLAFGSYVNPIYRFDKAAVVVTLDSDFLGTGPAHLRYARDFMAARKVRAGATKVVNRLYTIEASPSQTGGMADHRIVARPSQIEGYARAIAAGVGLGAAGAINENAGVIAALVRDLQKNRGNSIVIAGDDQPPVVHAIAHAINQALGNIGSTVFVTDSAEVQPVNQLESMRQLVTDMHAGSVSALIMLGGNPVFDAPADFRFEQALGKVAMRAHLSMYYDETSRVCHWHIPETHYLETWGDARAFDGTVSIVQPLIAPLYNGRTAYDMVGSLIGGMDAPAYDSVRRYWSAKSGGVNFENSWKKWLHDGVIAGSTLPPRTMSASTSIAAPQPKQISGVEIELRPDPTIYDGRFANNGWLQELPKPVTKVVWDNVMLVSPKTAKKYGFEHTATDLNEKMTTMVEVQYHGKTLVLPMWPAPGQAEDVATIYFGYGRRHGGRLAAPEGEEPIGFDTYAFRTSDAMSGGAGATLRNANKPSYKIACTQEHQSINRDETGGDRGIVRAATFAEYQKTPAFAKEYDEEPGGKAGGKDDTMYPNYAYKDYAWAMVIDTSICTGCNGCVVACQSENNIAIVGKDQVHRERELHWLRIDRYYRGSAENPEVYNQPVPCMQCENAPCEPVCPVEATSHNQDGLNDMTYNRCIGTRYCSNNCPWKVRRFNFYHYSDYDTPSLKAQRNPDVTVRTRGVMEKCTYCVQRVNEAKINAEREDRKVRDGEIVTACQQACPTGAIIFGNMNDANSEVAKLKLEPTNYATLAELNTRPRTTYLATIRNPNPEIKAE
jgi:molybdopterin-containing oxidoreductase family iron-sulfur binding subunit